MSALKDQDLSVQTVENGSEILNNIPRTLYSVSVKAAHKLIFISKNITSLLGYNCRELLEDDDFPCSIVKEEDKSRVRQIYDDCVHTGRGFSIDYRVNTKDGSILNVADRAAPAFDDNGQVIRIDGLLEDITERRRAERELNRTQMLQAIGKLAAGVAHEINTPIQFVGDNIHFLSNSFEQLNSVMKAYAHLKEQAAQHTELKGIIDEINRLEQEADIDFLNREIPAALEQSREGIDRVSAMVSAMRDFSHLDERRKVLADINKALKSTVVILRNELKYVADVEMDFDPAIPKLMCHLDDLNQVFLNLLINAGHAVDEVIDTSKNERGLITIKTSLENDNIIIKISDSGPGIDTAVGDKIFEQFFTTKEPGKGTGQGLYIAQSIIKNKHAGSIDFESEPGKGTVFIVSLPIDVEAR